MACGAQIRSRAESEKNTAYFFCLEKAQGNSRILDSIRKDSGQVITKQSEILNELTGFLKERYKGITNFNETNAEEFVENLEIPKLSNEKKNQLEGDITEEGIALKELNNNSAPG